MFIIYVNRSCSFTHPLSFIAFQKQLEVLQCENYQDSLSDAVSWVHEQDLCQSDLVVRSEECEAEVSGAEGGTVTPVNIAPSAFSLGAGKSGWQLGVT